jgi:hypothetical protein
VPLLAPGVAVAAAGELEYAFGHGERSNVLQDVFWWENQNEDCLSFIHEKSQVLVGGVDGLVAMSSSSHASPLPAVGPCEWGIRRRAGRKSGSRPAFRALGTRSLGHWGRQGVHHRWNDLNLRAHDYEDYLLRTMYSTFPDSNRPRV